MAKTTGFSVPPRCSTTSPRPGKTACPTCAPRSWNSPTNPPVTRRAPEPRQRTAAPARRTRWLLPAASTPGRASESRMSAARRTRGTAPRGWPWRQASAGAASVTRRSPSSRRIPRKLIANTFTKQVTASAAVSASPAPHRANTIFAPIEDSSAERSIICSVSHSLTKPLNGGSAAIESVPTRKASAVSGIHLIRPPSWSMSRVPVCVSTAPTPKNSSAL